MHFGFVTLTLPPGTSTPVGPAELPRSERLLTNLLLTFESFCARPLVLGAHSSPQSCKRGAFFFYFECRRWCWWHTYRPRYSATQVQLMSRAHSLCTHAHHADPQSERSIHTNTNRFTHTRHSAWTSIPPAHSRNPTATAVPVDATRGSCPVQSPLPPCRAAPVTRSSAESSPQLKAMTCSSHAPL